MFGRSVVSHLSRPEHAGKLTHVLIEQKFRLCGSCSPLKPHPSSLLTDPVLQHAQFSSLQALNPFQALPSWLLGYLLPSLFKGPSVAAEYISLDH